MPSTNNSETSTDPAARFRVAWDKTTWSRDLESFAFKCTDELTPLDYFIGQERAHDAIRFGLEVDKPGYNLFVTGLTGTGKTSAIKSHLQSIVDDLDSQEKDGPSVTGATYTTLKMPTAPKWSGFPAAPARSIANN